MILLHPTHSLCVFGLLFSKSYFLAMPHYLSTLPLIAATGLGVKLCANNVEVYRAIWAFMFRAHVVLKASEIQLNIIVRVIYWYFSWGFHWDVVLFLHLFSEVAAADLLAVCCFGS
ncbi:hypothetical protein BC829DRAFT_380534, partial [Chytridium lagenaria]